MKRNILRILCVVSTILLTTLAPAVGDVIPWDGEISNVWFDDQNWLGDVRPAENDDAVDNVGPAIEYDDTEQDPWTDPGIATFTGSGAGTYSLTLLQEATLTVKTNMAYSGTGTYTIDVGQEALVSIGDVAGNFGGPFAASTSGFNWFVRGHLGFPLDERGVVEVTDRIFGSGEWTTESGRVSVGNDALGLPGRIESTSPWYVLGGLVEAGYIIDIDGWEISGGTVDFDVFMSVESLTMYGGSVEGTNSTEGDGQPLLYVKGTLTMEGQPPGVEVDALLVGDGGEIILNNDGVAVNQLRVVDGPATFRDGSRLTCDGDANFLELLHG